MFDHIENVKSRFAWGVTTGADGVVPIPAHQNASDRVWDETYERHRYHDGQTWVWREETGEKRQERRDRREKTGEGSVTGYS